jgi:threonine dehydratase
MLPLEWIDQAARRIAPYILRTPLTYDPEYDLYLKWENQQVTGSFKARGAFNKILTLEPWERENGLVTASAGNHGQGVALAGRETGARVTVFASEHAVPAKLEAMRELGAYIHLVPGGYGEAEVAALRYAEENHETWVSAYNDGQVIAGQGTIGLEVLDELPSLPETTWAVPAGGGGLAAGIGASLLARRDAHPRARMIAVQSEASPFLHALYHHGSQEGIVELPSLADGLAGPVEAHSLTIPLVRSLAETFILVSEAEIAEAIAACWRRYGERIEGSAAAALAAVLFGKIKEKPAVVVISGGNIGIEKFSDIVGE